MFWARMARVLHEDNTTGLDRDYLPGTKSTIRTLSIVCLGDLLLSLTKYRHIHSQDVLNSLNSDSWFLKSLKGY